jgi:hypothetical protein
MGSTKTIRNVSQTENLIEYYGIASFVIIKPNSSWDKAECLLSTE